MNRTAKGETSKDTKTQTLKHSKAAFVRRKVNQKAKSINIVPIFKNCMHRARDGSVVQSTGYPSRGLWLSSQHSLGSS